MSTYLGIDTSNYTTSTALYTSGAKQILQRKLPLPVKPGTVGLRQSDAVFGHVKALGSLLEQLLNGGEKPDAIGVSVTPRKAEGSYMPCFLAGEMAARSAAAAARVPLYAFSHQDGHIAAALFGAGRMDLLEGEFLAFHVSGGTTQCLYVQPDEQSVFRVEIVGRSLDLHAGQVVDRVGKLLGLSFPAGPELESLASQAQEDYTPRPAMKGGDCCLSGVENQCRDLLGKGWSGPQVAKYCLCALRQALSAMTEYALQQHPGLPVLYAGGVMSNRFLQAHMANVYGGGFAPPEYSADNAAGIALLCSIQHQKGAFHCSL